MNLARPREVWFLTASAAHGGGGVQHSRALLQAVSQLYGPRLTIIGRRELESIPLPRRAGQYVVVPRRSPMQKLWWLAAARGIDLLSPFVDRWLSARAERPAFAVLDRSWLGRFAHRLAEMGIRVVTMHHNVEVDYVADTNSTPLVRPWVMHIIGKNERLALHHSTANLTMTQEDEQRLREVYGLEEGTRIEVLGTFSELGKAASVVVSETSIDMLSYHVVITGSLCDAQTLNGVAWFLTDIFPLLKAQLPEVIVTVAGRAPTLGMRRLIEKAGVRLVADPEDMDAVVRQAHVYLSPARLGSGLKLRLGDGLRCGLPVVSHAVSARGYADLYPSPLFQVFREPEECVAALERVRRAVPLDLPTRRRIQDLYAQRFSFSAGVARLSAILRTHVDYDTLSPKA